MESALQAISTAGSPELAEVALGPARCPQLGMLSWRGPARAPARALALVLTWRPAAAGWRRAGAHAALPETAPGLA